MGAILKQGLRTALMVLSCALLACSILLLLLILSLVATQVAVALHAAPIALAVTRLMPGWLAFSWVLPSPFGGVFRTDFLILAAALFVAAKVCRGVAKHL